MAKIVAGRMTRIAPAASLPNSWMAKVARPAGAKPRKSLTSSELAAATAKTEARGIKLEVGEASGFSNPWT